MQYSRIAAAAIDKPEEMRLNENNGEDLNEVRSDKKIHDKSRFKWTIGRRLQFGFGVLLIIFLISAIYNYYKLNIIEIEARDLIDHAIPVENLTKELESALYRQQIAISKYMELPDHVQKKKYEHQKKEIKHILRELGSSALTDHERALVSSIEIKIKELLYCEVERWNGSCGSPVKTSQSFL